MFYSFDDVGVADASSGIDACCMILVWYYRTWCAMIAYHAGTPVKELLDVQINAESNVFKCSIRIYGII